MLKSLEIRGDRNWLGTGNDSVSLAAALLLAGSLLASQTSGQERQESFPAGPPGPVHDLEPPPWYPRPPRGRTVQDPIGSQAGGPLSGSQTGSDSDQDESMVGIGHSGGKLYPEMRRQNGQARRTSGSGRGKLLLTASHGHSRNSDIFPEDQIGFEELDNSHHFADLKRGPPGQRQLGSRQMQPRFRPGRPRTIDPEELADDGPMPQAVQPDFNQPIAAIEEYPNPTVNGNSNPTHPRLYVYIPPNPNANQNPNQNQNVNQNPFNQLSASGHPKILYPLV